MNRVFKLGAAGKSGLFPVAAGGKIVGCSIGGHRVVCDRVSDGVYRVNFFTVYLPNGYTTLLSFCKGYAYTEKSAYGRWYAADR